LPGCAACGERNPEFVALALRDGPDAAFQILKRRAVFFAGSALAVTVGIRPNYRRFAAVTFHHGARFRQGK